MTRISIVEDDQLIAQMYRMKLEDAGFKVDVAENGMTAIQMIKDTKPDLILLDYSLPDIDGGAVLKEVRRNGTATDIPVIVLTNMDNDSVRQELSECGIEDYIVKVELTPKEVVKRIKEVLARDKH